MSLTRTTAPTTPAAQTQTPNSLAASQTQIDTPGTWRHPRLDEITRRQRAAHFSTTNVRTIIFNILFLFATLITPPSYIRFFYDLLSATLASIPPSSIQWQDYGLTGLRLLCIANIVLALSPLYSQPDEMSDIPLTPSQRKLLGLNPTPASSAPPTPASGGYITPPRFSRSPSTSLQNTPNSGNSRRAVAGSSPGSVGRATGLAGSPFANGSPSQREREGSPLLHKAIAGSGGSRAGSGRRWSYGSNHSPLALGRSGSDSLLLGGDAGLGGSVLGGGPATPSPVGKAPQPSVGLNSKWLYQKGRSSLGGKGFY